MPKIRKPWVDWETFNQITGFTWTPGAHTHIVANITDWGDYLDQAVKEASSPIFATVKLSNLTDGYVPYHVDDATGLVDSPIWTDGTDVGMGTATPFNELQVVGISQFSPTAANSGIEIQGEFVAGNCSQRIYFKENEASDQYGFSLIFAGNADPTFNGTGFTLPTNTFYIMRHENVAAGAVVMAMDRVTGNVGIGTASPDAKVHITGSPAVGGAQLILSSTDADATLKDSRLAAKHYTNAEESLALIAGRTALAASRVMIGGGRAELNAATSIEFWTAANNTTLTGTQRMTIDSSGKVGIGTALPLTLLHLEAFEPFLRLHSTRSGNYWDLAVENPADVFDISRNDVTFVRISDAGLVTITGSILMTGDSDITATGYLHLTAAGGEHMYFDAGNEFLWRDQDGGDALRMRLDSATGNLTVTGTITGDVHWDNITNEPVAYPPLYHLHVGMDIVSLMLVDTTDTREPPADPFDVLTTGDHINGQGTYDWFDSWVSGHAGAGCSGKIEVLAGADKMLELIDSANINSMAHVYLDTSTGHELMIAALSVRLRSTRNDRKSAMYLYEGAAPGMRVELDSDGDIKLFDGAGTTVLQAYAANTWYTIRMYWDCVSQAVAIFVDNVFRTRKNITGTDFVGRIGFYTDITLESYTFHADDLKIFNLTV